MANLCLNCGRTTYNRTSTYKKCNASLGHALQLDTLTPSRRPLMLIGIVGILILVVVVVNTFAVICF